MNDEEKRNSEADLTRLEQTLIRFQPASLPVTLQNHLEAAASSARPRASTFADNLLALWTLGGALAACIVLALTLLQLGATPQAAPASSQDFALHQQTVLEFEKLIASR